MNTRNTALWALLWTAVASPLVTAPALAQTPSPLAFPVGNFNPAPSTEGYLVTENGSVQDHLQPSVQLVFNYAKRPLQLVDTGNSDSREAEVVSGRVNLDLMAAIGFFDRLELGIALPVTVSQSGDRASILDRTEPLSGGFKDIRLVPKLRLTNPEATTGFALALPLTIPSGDDENLLGAGTVQFAPQLILSFDTDYFDLAFNAGVRLRSENNVSFTPSQKNLSFGNEFYGSVGMKIAPVPETFEIVIDYFTSVGLAEQDTEEVAMELLAGPRFHFARGWIAQAGAGPGLTKGIGVPAFRVYAGVGYVHMPDPDRDKDGILNEDDSCPDNPEDKDNFEDVDGCPEPDNDKDTILDVDDKCVNTPEDHDKFEDADGCPDPDNDKDNILDAQDECPMDAEDFDQFEDENGCPDPDNDMDGVLDVTDQCPLKPEDVDTFEDENGCPDPDNDKDTILDVDDKCPMEPEIFNENEDEDGCPDQAKGPVKIEHGKITAPPVFFATGKDRILAQSFPILEMVANTFKQNAWVKKVRVEGHTDDRGKDAYNLKLSAARAASVVTFLIEQGVEPERIESEGYGETRPVADNKKKEGRAKNRRVEFIILDPPQSQEPSPGTTAADGTAPPQETK